MTLKDQIPLGMVLPHRSPDPIDIGVVRQVAERADGLGFSDLWVTENTLDHVFCFDPMVVLTYAAAVTTTIRLGVSVVVLPMHHPAHVAHQVASLDYVSNGRAILGVGLGREAHYAEFQVPRERRVRRFREGVELIKALWTEPQVPPAPWRLNPCRSRVHRSGWVEPTRMPCVGLRPSPTVGWAQEVRAQRRSPAVYPSCERPWRKRDVTPIHFPSRSGFSCPCMSARRPRGRSYTTGSAWSITTPMGPMPQGFMALRNACGSSCKGWWRWALTTCCLTQSVAISSSWRLWQPWQSWREAARLRRPQPSSGEASHLTRSCATPRVTKHGVLR
jgi:luciferase-like monooxygenase